MIRKIKQHQEELGTSFQTVRSKRDEEELKKHDRRKPEKRKTL